MSERNSPHQLVAEVAADFGLALASMAAVLAATAAAEVLNGRGGYGYEALRYFAIFACGLAPLFPGALSASGAYRRDFTSIRARFRALAAGVAGGCALFLSASALMSHPALDRAGALAFCILFALSVFGLRVVRAAARRAGAVRHAPAVAVRSTSPVLVIGGAGYIGSVLVDRLLQWDVPVRVLDSLVYGDRALRHLRHHPRLEFIGADCRNLQAVVTAMQGVRSVVHLAAIVGDAACDHDPEKTLEINTAAACMAAAVAKGAGVRRFVFASTCSIYGATDKLVDEDAAPNPVSLYALSKLDAERGVLECRSESFHPTSLRVATVFGNSFRPRFDLAVNVMTARAFSEGLIPVYNGDSWRPFIHVQDVVSGILAALTAPSVSISGQVFNLGDSRLNHTLLEVGQHVQRAFPGARIECSENGDRRNYRVSFDKIRDELNFRCERTLDDGILELKRALEARAIADYRDALFHNHRFLAQGSVPASTNELDGHLMAAFIASRNSRRAVA